MGGKEMIATRKNFIGLLKDHMQAPEAVNRTETMFECDSAGTFYVLEYDGDSAGWTLSHNQLKKLQKYKKNCIVFLDSENDELFVVFDDNKDFYDSLKNLTSPYKISKSYLKKGGYEISWESFDDYLAKP